MQELIEKAKKYVRQTFENEYSGHDYFHTFRVYSLATKIAKEEGASLPMVQLSALLHDLDDRKLSPNTCKNKDRARSFLLENGVEKQTVELICDIIEEVSFKGSDSVCPQTLEGKCVQDADRLDAIGAIGIARAFAFGGNRNRVMHDPEIQPKLNMSGEEYRAHVSTTVNHFYEKLFSLASLMNTKTAIKIAKERQRYMQDYIARFLAEWNGEI